MASRPDMDSDEAKAAWSELSEAFEKYQRVMHGDDTIVNFGFIFEASSSGAESGECTIWGALGSRTEKLGLLAMLTANVEQACIPQLASGED